jgi:sensor histidine kinase YesM
VPTLLLQPLVENAIRHGVGPRAQAGVIVVRTARQNESLEIEVRDNGRGLPENGRIEEGVGLSNTRARLQQLYGEAFRFEFHTADEGGLTVRLRIPWRTESGRRDRASAPGGGAVPSDSRGG